MSRIITHMGHVSYNDIHESWQIKAMVEAGVDVMMLETFTFLSEIKIALLVRH